MFARLRPLVVLAFTSCLMLMGCSANSEKSSASNAVLWKIEKSGVPESWLFGTAHISDSRVAKFSPAVEAALNQSKHIGTEIKIDFGSMMAMGNAMLTKEPTLPAKLSAEQYTKLLPELAAREYPEVAAAKFKPWAAAMLLMTPAKVKGEIPMDMRVMKHAMENEKDYFGVETVDEQLSYFQNIPEAKQIVLLNALISQQDKLAKSYEQLLNAYVKQDLDALQKLAEQDEISLPEADQAWFKEWQTKLISERNPVMAKRIQEHLLEGNAFIAIGALHLPGKDGLIERLRAAGYTVTPVLK
ncbi:TraB/GumN family protein [Chitinibacter bivalviorum]|uniref:TraB/GumN family protein n=1 Tax=Chitinibacter bivalviorum TaxID=2739434 RepID=A0A7H9BI25_9NEIS|nr:TraB/GumN family protein [Chitinibacter bivalviorum]QLG88287.1 TraB/GumN family protein [Chitinibacter bivalviorum]